LETIYGSLERITFYNEENHFIVAKLKEKRKRDLTTIVGNLAGLNPGVYLKLEGKWVLNPKYGEQFEVERYETLVPATAKGIEKYLGSGLIKGIGPKMASRMVKVFGENTIDVIESAPHKLSQVEGIGPKRIEMISNAWEEQKHIKDIMLFLQENGVSAAYSAKIFKTYGEDSIKVVSENPYRLASDIRGIGFVIADKIAQKMGFGSESLPRIKEGILYVLDNLVNEGHIYYPYEPLTDKAAEMLQVSKEKVSKAIAELFEEERIIIEDLVSDEKGTEELANQKAVYKPPFYIAEVNMAQRLKKLRDEQSLVSHFDLENVIERIERKLSIKLAPKQKEAILLAIQNKVMVITGGPGTGKTTIIKSIIYIYREMGLKVLLAAPTGRAAKRMQEATGFEAKTIHRLLEYSPQNGGFQRNQENPLNADVVIVDEASMIDTLLMYNLVKAIPTEATFIMVGDVFQLPSVGPGNVLRDIIDSKVFEVVTLTEIFRQSRESKIVLNAHRINNGEFPDIRRPPQGKLSDFYFMEEEDPEQVVEKICRLCKYHIPRRFNYDPLRDIQVLTPMHRGKMGVANLNNELQNNLNNARGGISHGSRTFNINDKVMQLENNYDKEVYNGDIGFISVINQEDREVLIDFDNRRIKYDILELDELALAYAVSVHKSQGSEYPVVIIPVMTQHYILLQRNLIYTGITRGKKMVILIGTKKALGMAISNNKPLERFTRLKERLADLSSTTAKMHQAERS